jgi:ketosteroid isomerase-like protein
MNLKSSTFLFFACFLFTGSLAADTRSDIETALEYYAEMWNEGDIDAISGYYHQDFVLVEKGGPVQAGQRIDDLKTIAKAGEDRGELSYSNVTVKPLEKKHAMAYGKLNLKFKDGSAIETWFTTAYVNTPFGWKAILTHN